MKYTKISFLCCALISLSSCSNARSNQRHTDVEDSTIVESVDEPNEVYTRLSNEFDHSINLEDIYSYEDVATLFDGEKSSDFDIYNNNTNVTYHVYKDSFGNITISGSDGTSYNFYSDNFGNTSGSDSQGNSYNFYTDDFGNTSGFDSNGNSYSSYTDDFGNTTTYTDDGTYQSYTDGFGNTTTYGPDGQTYQSYTDDFRNTTITSY